MVRRTAGLWGAVGFTAATIAAARRQPGYSHRREHVSALAAHGERSATIMVPGFVALAAAQCIVATPTPALRRMVRVAAATTLAAGVIQVSDRSCPQPDDPEATLSDLGHGAASIATFVLWAAMPVVAARSDGHGWYTPMARVVTVPTIAAFVTAGVTTRLNSPHKGMAQRTFLALTFLFLGATGLGPSAWRHRVGQ